MHELSLCQALIGQLQALARERGARRICLARVGVGPLSGVEPQLLQQAWPVARAGTPAENCELVLEPLPLRVHCPRCGRDSEAQSNRLLCAHCGDWHTRVIGGDELLLNSVELICEQREAV